MKKNIPYKLFVIIVFLFSTWLHNRAKAQTYKESKYLERSYKVSASTTLDVENKYGKIHIKTWNKDSVLIKINLTIKSDEKERVQELMDDIDFDFTATSYYITAKTTFGNKRKSFFDDLRRLAQTFTSLENETTIDYEIFVPQYLSLKMNNKYGDFYTDNIEGNLDLSIAYGDFKINKLFGDAYIDTKFGKGSINYAKNAKINSSFTEIQVFDSDRLSINSNSSTIKIKNNKTLRVDSRRDKFYIDLTRFIYGKTYFSDIWIYKLQTESTLNAKYGLLNFELVQPGFDFIKLNTKYTDINLFIKNGSSYQIDLTHHNAVIKKPEGVNWKEKTVDEDKEKYMTFGHVGNNNAKSKIRIDIDNGNLNIYHK